MDLIYYVSMLYIILGKLFKSDPFDTRYTPKPLHLAYSLLFVAVGIKSVNSYDWIYFGLFSTFIGSLLGITIILGMNWDKAIEYWMTINYNIKLMMKVKDPDIWIALGYKSIPQSVNVVETEDTGQGFIATRYKNYHISPSRLNLVSNKVLGTGKATFTEDDYSALIPNFRKVRREWIKDGYVTPLHKDNPRLGYAFSKKGMDMIYQFASDSVKLKEK